MCNNRIFFLYLFNYNNINIWKKSTDVIQWQQYQPLKVFFTVHEAISLNYLQPKNFFFYFIYFLNIFFVCAYFFAVAFWTAYIWVFHRWTLENSPTVETSGGKTDSLRWSRPPRQEK